MTDFPSSPIVGQIHTYGGITYNWTGEKWIIAPGAVRHSINRTQFGNVDLSKGVFHKLSTNDSAVVNFENIPQGASRWSLEVDIDGVTKYDLVNSSNTTPIASLVLSGDGFSYQTFFKPEGDKLFFVGDQNDRVYTFNLSTPWDITTATAGNFFSVSGFDTATFGLSFDPTGRYMYVGGGATRTVFQFELSDRWNVATASLIKTRSLNPPMTTGGPFCIQFSPTGDKMFALGLPSATAGQAYVYEFILSTPWDVSTATYTTGNLFQVGLQDSGATSFAFRPDGRKMYMIGTTNDLVHSYTLSTPWQINTVAYDSVTFTQAATAEGNPTNVMFNNDGSRMFISGTTLDVLREYRTSYSRAAYNGSIQFPSNVRFNNASVPAIEMTAGGTGNGDETVATTSIIDFTTPDGGTTIYANERFNRPVNKPSTAESVKFIRSIGTLTDTTTTWSGPTFMTIPSTLRNQDARFVVEWIVPTASTLTQMDLIVFAGNTYSFENTNHGFEYVYLAGTSTYQTATGWTTLPNTGASTGANAWTITTSNSSGQGSWNVTGQGGTAGFKLFLRSPIISLGSSPTVSFYTRRPNGGTHNYYITNI